MDDTDLSGLDLAGAKAYLLDYATSAKLARKAIEAVDADIALWGKRVALAEGKGMADLAQAAKARLEELEAKRAPLLAELADIEAKVRRIREKLPMVAAKERSVDPDRLLAELQMLTGTLLDEGPGGSSLEAQMAALESESAAAEASAGADAGLQALKDKLGGKGA
ncbi:MAG TPA: hypothetical protein VMV44_16550 [Rectinemataceae bacterium]|nr:hypothetical protein [Rectinemataceae bacterium]